MQTDTNYEQRADEIYRDMLTELVRCGDQEFYAIDEEIEEYFKRLVPLIRLDLLMEKAPEWHENSYRDGLWDFLYQKAKEKAQREKR